MSSTDRPQAIDASWQQLEDFVDRLHAVARAPGDTATFYRQLVEGCVATLAAEGGAAWRRDRLGRWQVVHQINLHQAVELGDSAVQTAHTALLQEIAASPRPRVIPPRSGVADALENPSDAVIVAGAVHDAVEPTSAQPLAVIELFLRAGSSPAVQQGWSELLATVCQIAAEFHTLDQLRALREERGLHSQWLALFDRIHSPVELTQTAFEIVNEGRQLVGADRLSVVMRRGRRWRLLASSGLDRIEARADTTKRLETLADKSACWGEPIDYADARAADELPAELAAVVEQHVDQSHARRLVAVPIVFAPVEDQPSTRRAPPPQVSAVLIAEQFDSASDQFARDHVVELAQMSAGALQQASRMDRFPLRGALRWADRWQRWTRSWGVSRIGLAAAAVVALIAALVLVQVDFEVEAPATLAPLVERDVFATTSGTVREVRITHGQQVAAGEVLAVLDDPQLALDAQRVEGEIETIRRRLEAIAVSRTDRRTQEAASGERLPLSAEAEQLQQQLLSLVEQRDILNSRRAALTLTSPIAGQVLTLDVQNLLRARPVERGQVLFSVADTSAGWRLLADVSQDRIGHVVAASQSHEAALPVRFRLAGDSRRTFVGTVESIAATAVLATDELADEPPTVRVRVAVADDQLPAARPGMNAEVRIRCGRRSLGYVWLHDVWETIYSWLVF